MKNIYPVFIQEMIKNKPAFIQEMIKNNPGFGGKKTKITFEKTFEKKIITFPKCFPSRRTVIKGGHIPPLPPFCACRACRCGLLRRTLRYPLTARPPQKILFHKLPSANASLIRGLSSPN